MRGTSKRFDPDAWVQKLVPIVLGFLLLVLLAVLVIVGLAMAA